MCLEPNQPDPKDIKQSLNGDYSLKNIYNTCKTHRKHLIFLYVYFNDLDIPDISFDLIKKYTKFIIMLKDKVRGNKLPNYYYVLDYLCKKLNYPEIRKYLYIKKQNVKWDKLIEHTCGLGC